MKRAELQQYKDLKEYRDKVLKCLMSDIARKAKRSIASVWRLENGLGPKKHVNLAEYITAYGLSRNPREFHRMIGGGK